ncbi:MAG: type ISP restriction/modification enzyme [Pirellulaceae bacterium]
MATSHKTDDYARQQLAVKVARRFAAAARRDGDRRSGEKGMRQQTQAAACAALALCGCRPRLSETALEWLLAAGDAATRLVLQTALRIEQQCRGRCGEVDEGWPCLSPAELEALPGPVECAERFLAEFDKALRAAQGFYVTPPQLARFIVSAVHRCLQEEFGLPDGLLDETTWRDAARRCDAAPPPGVNEQWLAAPLVRLLDPAVGSGAFLAAVVEVAYDAYRQSPKQQSWSEVLANSLLPRMVGIELLPSVAVCAHIAVADALQRTGFDFSVTARPRIYVGDTLAALDARHGSLENGEIQQQRELDFVRREEPFTVVVGNPPFLAAALPGQRWIEELLKGRGPRGEATANYYEIGGQSLGEKKLWLHDDYVKFLRYAQWRIEQAGCGVVGMVTNHGYLDNATFRGMREKLLRGFSRVTIVDLHGNSKKKEKPPPGNLNQNVFSIQQGSAVALMRRPMANLPAHLDYAEVWGTRDEKLQTLDKAAPVDLGPTRITPSAPHFFLVPHDARLAEEYSKGWSLPEVMPVNTTAPVTARDRFVVALDAEPLARRMEEFRNLDISDEEIRARYFNRTRSVRYAAGDTRGWSLKRARRELAANEQWRSAIRDCLYRPFDRRSIYWSPNMIDWPRSDVMRHLEHGDNLALIARRQMPPGEPCTYFWITDEIALDGVIRSDNRGSESLFPLWLFEDQESAPRANFHRNFVRCICERLELTWCDEGPEANLRQRSERRTLLRPEDLLAYVYALFHGETYRERYAEHLRIEFPRIFAPRNPELFFALADRGRRLIALHCLTAEAPGKPALVQIENEAPVVKFPRYGRDAIQINERCWFEPVPSRTWSFRAGAHQVCRKWLKDRQGRTLSRQEVACFQSIVAAIGATLDVVREIEETLETHGGWRRAFVID